MNIHAKWQPFLIEYMTTCLKVFVVIHLCPAVVTYTVTRQDLSSLSLHYIKINYRFGMLYATLVKYYCDVPASDAVTFLGFPVSGKIFIYSLALQAS